MTGAGMTPEEFSAAEMAADAMKLALAQDWDGANALAQGLLDIYGQHGGFVAMLLWADSIIEYRGGPLSPAFHQLTFFDVDAGPQPIQHGADAAPPWARWAGRFIFARAHDDRTQCHALIATCVDGPEFESNMLGVLEMVAQTIIHAERYRRGQ